jgi:DNA-binding NarL/FixJ family response regulator
MPLPGGTYRLTKQQLDFIRAYAREGKTQSEAYRRAYQTNATPRGVSAQAHRLMRKLSVRAAIETMRLQILRS